MFRGEGHLCLRGGDRRFCRVPSCAVNRVLFAITRIIHPDIALLELMMDWVCVIFFLFLLFNYILLTEASHD